MTTDGRFGAFLFGNGVSRLYSILVLGAAAYAAVDRLGSHGDASFAAAWVFLATGPTSTLFAWVIDALSLPIGLAFVGVPLGALANLAVINRIVQNSRPLPAPRPQARVYAGQ